MLRSQINSTDDTLMSSSRKVLSFTIRVLSRCHFSRENSRDKFNENRKFCKFYLLIRVSNKAKCLFRYKVDLLFCKYRNAFHNKSTLNFMNDGKGEGVRLKKRESFYS